jgi:hypothetical protein
MGMKAGWPQATTGTAALPLLAACVRTGAWTISSFGLVSHAEVVRFIGFGPGRPVA